MDNEKPGFWAILPAVVRYDSSIPPMARLLYSEISALCDKEGICYAGNQYFTRVFDLSVKQVSRLMLLLQKAGHVNIKINKKMGNRREITLNYSKRGDRVSPKMSISMDKNVHRVSPKMSISMDKNVSHDHDLKQERINKKEREGEGEPQERQSEQPPAPPVLPSRNSFPVFGEFQNVHLSEIEQKKLLEYLKASFPTLNGKADIALHGLIESMSAWQINHPERPISNHYAGLRSWIDADRKKGIVPGQPAKKYEKDDRTPFRKTLDAMARLRFDENDNIIILEDGQDDKTGNVESCYPDFSILSGKIQTAV